MLQQRSKLFAGDIERPRLAPTWVIAAIAVLILALLVLIFPQRALIKRLVASSEQSELATAYLVNLLRSEPQNPELRLVLARQQYRLGRLAAAEKTLAASLSSDQPTVREDAAWLLWMIRVREFERAAEDSPQRQQARSALHLELARLATEQWSEAMTLDLARYALAIGESELGLRMLSDLGQRRSDLGPDWFNRAAGDALGQGQYRVAAELFFIARLRAITLDERRQAYIAGLRALQAGNLMVDAVVAGERELKDLGDDKESLYTLVEIARSANRLDVADKYARRMLRLSLIEQWQGIASGPDFGGRYLPVSADADGTAPLPFDDKVYRLGYEVFLNNRKPEDAYRVAAAAVRQAPNNLVWRERLARVAEWSGKPQVALENWLILAERSGRDEYWQGVLRLAPGLFDDEALLAALRYQLAKKPDEGKWQTEIADAFERLGRPRDGLAYLQQLHARTGRPELLEAIAMLAERSGDIDTALAAWRRLLAQRVPTAAQALRAATLMLQAGRLDDATATLDRASTSARDSDGAYWRLTGELARRQQRDAAALDAYSHLIAGGMAEANDYTAAVTLLRDDQPGQAAHVAAAGWRKFKTPTLYQQALALLAAQGLWREVGDLLAEPDAATRADFEHRTDFLRLRAEYFQHRGEPQRARRDLEAALVFAPDASGVRQALLWLAIDGNDAAALRHLLAHHEIEWAADPALHDSLAAAWQALSLPQPALDHYLTPHLSEHRGDLLWLMNYADALEQNQETDRAWRLRMELWLHARRDHGNTLSLEAAQDSVRRAARTRLEITQGGGDRGLAALREQLRLDRDSEGSPTPAAREAKLAWLQGAGEYSAERGYLWQQYSRSLARPLWAEISVALAENDREALADLLERYGERLPRHDRINAARSVDDVRLAQSDAFATAGLQPGDDVLQDQLSEALRTFSDSARSKAVTRQLGSIAEQERSAGLDLALNPRLSFGLDAGEIKRENRDAAVLADVPASESTVAARLRIGPAESETRIVVAARDSLRSYHSWSIEHEQRLDNRLTFVAGLGRHLPSPESSALLVAGMKDQAELGFSYQISQRERLSLRWLDEHYLGQSGTGLGQGSSWHGELGVPLRLETPDFSLSGFFSQYRFSRNGAGDDAALRSLIPAQSGVGVTDFFIPDGFRFYGLRVSSNMRFAGESGEYTRAIRPYAAAAWTHHSEAGTGYDIAAGLAASAFGADRLTLGWALAKGGNTSYNHVRELGMYYRAHF